MLSPSKHEEAFPFGSIIADIDCSATYVSWYSHLLQVSRANDVLIMKVHDVDQQFCLFPLKWTRLNLVLPYSFTSQDETGFGIHDSSDSNNKTRKRHCFVHTVSVKSTQPDLSQEMKVHD